MGMTCKGSCAAAVVLLLATAVRAETAPEPAETAPAPQVADSRIRTAAYDSSQVYRIEGRVGYQVDIQFEDDESFLGLGAGDLQALSFVAQGSHLFIKPRVASVDTNLTVLTTRRAYHFDYTVSGKEGVYVLKFVYPTATAAEVDRLLKSGPGNAGNLDYWYCGDPSLKPLYATDDGVHTRLRFPARAELPAVFVRNDDGGEALLNFNVENGDVVIHRVARKFVLRRGKLTGCIVNAAYGGSGKRLESGTVSPAVERAIRGRAP